MAPARGDKPCDESPCPLRTRDLVITTKCAKLRVGVCWSCLKFQSLSWWLSAWDSLLLVEFPCLDVENTCCNGRVCGRSQMVIVAVIARTCAYMSLFMPKRDRCCDSITIEKWQLQRVTCVGALRNEKRWFRTPQCAM